MKISYTVSGQTRSIELQAKGEGYLAMLDGQQHLLRILNSLPGELNLEIDDRSEKIIWAKAGRKMWLHLHGKSYHLEKAAGKAWAAGVVPSAERVLRAPMPGQVRQVLVQKGEVVKAGATLLLLEAMKMEMRIQAPDNAKVARVAIKEGENVEKEQILIELDPEEK